MLTYISKLSIISMAVLLISVVGISQEEGEPVPFAIAEKIPVYPGCEDLEGENLKDCTVKKISNHVNTNFNTSLGKELGLEGESRIVVQFKINNQGKITNVRSRSLANEAEARKSLEKEANRVVSSLPQMKPGEFKGKEVDVMYSLPIVFATPKKEE